jgi:hypothetical protein
LGTDFWRFSLRKLKGADGFEMRLLPSEDGVSQFEHLNDSKQTETHFVVESWLAPSRAGSIFGPKTHDNERRLDNGC